MIKHEHRCMECKEIQWCNKSASCWRPNSVTCDECWEKILVDAQNARMARRLEEFEEASRLDEFLEDSRLD
jgi:DNA-directed RNA polymerase subunit RPC12/RpoP